MCVWMSLFITINSPFVNFTSFIESSLVIGVTVVLMSSILLHARDEPDNGVNVEVDLVFSNEISISSFMTSMLMFLWFFNNTLFISCRRTGIFRLLEESSSMLIFEDLAWDSDFVEERRYSLVNLLSCEDKLALWLSNTHFSLL